MSRVQRWPSGEPRVAWICQDCVVDLGGGFKPNHVATTHTGECQVCKYTKPVMQTREFLWDSCASGACD